VRVLLVIKSLGHGGAEQLVVDTVANGDHGAFEYEVAFVFGSERSFGPVLESGGTPVHALGATRNFDVRWLPRFHRLLRQGRFDIVHFHLPYTAALGRPVVASMPARSRPVTLYTEHSMWNKVSPLVKTLNRATVSRDGALIAVSGAAYDSLPRALRPRAEVIVHGVDLSRSAAVIETDDDARRDVRAELGIAEEDILVVTVANLRSEKGYDVLLDAARLVLDRQLPVRFAAAGQGTLEAELTARRDELDLGERFRFLGYRPDALRLLAAADAFVLASHQEGLPVVLMEAMSMGLAIVATSVGGVPQVITDGGNGLLVRPGDAAGLARAIEAVGTDPGLRRELGRKAKEDSAAFDAARASGEIEQIYRRLLETGR
jgi:glycosyltransferase involved in cell wall biosynthesis